MSAYLPKAHPSAISPLAISSLSLSWATLHNVMGILQSVSLTLQRCKEDEAEKTNMLGKIQSPVLDEQELEQPDPH